MLIRAKFFAMKICESKKSKRLAEKYKALL